MASSSTVGDTFKVPRLPGISLVPVEEDIPESDKTDEQPPQKVPDDDVVITKVKPSPPPPALSVPYTEPSWSGPPPPGYTLEVIKNGNIVETIDLSVVGGGGEKRHFFVVGRFATCDIRMEHPSLSRFHAVLQFRGEEDGENPRGFYLYDLGSSHGTLHNKHRCFPKKYYRLRVGHAMRFGGSTRMLVLQGPPEDEEEESDLSVTELQKEARRRAGEKAAQAERMKKEVEQEEERKRREEDSRGISWGMIDDATEEEGGEEEEDGRLPDMSKNPFSQTGGGGDNESLYLDDPKKTLRGWFEREGYELEYKCEEKGYATFCCTIELPINSAESGGPVVAEVTVKGKKKEAVVQCALEACRILDRQGLLRQANHESRTKMQIKTWEDNDFYGSDEDDYLDRTGSIEKKRKARMVMAGKGEKQEVETYDSLQGKLKVVKDEMESVEKLLAKAREAKARAGGEEDLDAFMANIKHAVGGDKDTIMKHKRHLIDLQKEANRLSRLVDIARPASMPALRSDGGEKTGGAKFQGVMVGKRKGGLASRKTINPSDKVLPKASLPEGGCGGEEVEKAKPVFTAPETIVKEEPDEVKSVPREEIGENIQSKKVSKGPSIPDHMLRELHKDATPSGVQQAMEHEVKPVAASGPTRGRVTKRKGPSNEGSGSSSKVEEDDVPGDYNVSDPKYAVWMPPEGQSGDGRTSLNDKLGY